MASHNLILALASLAFAGLCLNPRLLRATGWHATVTPLASIIGSGFLVAGPILAATSGTEAWIAMPGLCGLGYLFGSACRHNIRYIEPLLDQHPPPVMRRLEQLSELALAIAYFVSVAYYLNLFAAFGLRLAGIIDPFWIRVLATSVLALVGTLAWRGGLGTLERLELGAVGLKLSLIGGLLTALMVASVQAFHADQFHWSPLPHPHGMREFQVLLGLVILVQGFETSRYLGHRYDTETRVKTMCLAQWLSTGIYLSFVLLITRYFTYGLPSVGGETAIIDMLKSLGSFLAPMITIAALASQLSAAVADTNGAGGLLAERFPGKFSVNASSLTRTLVAIAITWLANIYQIITYASKMFVVYYGLQSLQAARSAWQRGQKIRSTLYGFGVIIAGVIIVIAIPADA